MTFQEQLLAQQQASQQNRDILSPSITPIPSTLQEDTIDLSDVQDGDTINGNRLTGFDTAESYVDSNKARRVLENTGISLARQKQIGLQGKTSLEGYLQDNPELQFQEAGKGYYGRNLLTNEALTDYQLASGTAVPTEKYDQKRQELFRRKLEKRDGLFGENNVELELLRQEQLNRQEVTVGKRASDTVDALQAGAVKAVADTADFLLDVLTPGDNTLFNEAKKQENVDKFVGYDRRESQFQLDEAAHEWRQGDYVGAITRVVTTPEIVAESLPRMAEMFVGLGKFSKLDKAEGALKKVGKAINHLSKNAGFYSVVGADANNQLEERKINNNGKEPNAAEIVGVTAESLLMNGLDKLAFASLVKTPKSVLALKEVAKVVPKNQIARVAKTVGLVAADITVSAGKEAAQEYVQTWGQILGEQAFTENKGDDLLGEENQLEVLKGTLAGAGSGAQIRGTAKTAQAALSPEVREVAKKAIEAVATTEQEKTRLASVGATPKTEVAKEELAPEIQEAVTVAREAVENKSIEEATEAKKALGVKIVQLEDGPTKTKAINEYKAILQSIALKQKDNTENIVKVVDDYKKDGTKPSTLGSSDSIKDAFKLGIQFDLPSEDIDTLAKAIGLDEKSLQGYKQDQEALSTLKDSIKSGDRKTQERVEYEVTIGPKGIQRQYEELKLAEVSGDVSTATNIIGSLSKFKATQEHKVEKLQEAIDTVENTNRPVTVKYAIGENTDTFTVHATQKGVAAAKSIVDRASQTVESITTILGNTQYVQEVKVDKEPSVTEVVSKIVNNEELSLQEQQVRVNNKKQVESELRTIAKDTEAIDNIISNSSSTLQSKTVGNKGQRQQKVQLGDIVQSVKGSTLASEDISKPSDERPEVVGKFLKLTKELSRAIPKLGKSEAFALKDSLSRGLIYNKNGKLNANTLTAIAISAEDYVQFNASKLAWNDDEAIAKMLNIDVANVSTEHRLKLRRQGLHKKLVANSLGSTIMSNLGIKARKDVDEEIVAKLKADLGQVALVYLQTRGYINRLDDIESVMTVKEYNRLTSNVDSNSDGYVTFVRLNKDFKLTLSRTTLINEMNEYIKGESSKRGPTTKKPKGDREVSTRGNVVTNTPAKSQEVVNTLEKEAYEIDQNSMGLLDEIGVDKAKELMGYIEDTSNMAYLDKESQVAKNLEISNSIQYLQDLDSDIEGKSLYYKWFFSINGRYMIDSNTVNSQTDKLHRFLVTPKSHNVTISNDKDRRTFKVAIAQAFGFSIDKKSTPEAITFAESVLESDIKDIQKVLENGHHTLSNGVEVEIEELGHVLQAISAVKAYKESPENFNTNLTMELDAITSGFILKLLQLPVIKDVKDWLSKGGIYTPEYDNYKNVSGTNSELASGLVDSYKTLAQDAKNITYTGKNMDVWNSLTPLLPNMFDETTGEVTSEGRSVFKGPFMTFNYGASLGSVKDSMAYDMIKDVPTQMLLGNADQLLTSINQLLPTESKITKEVLQSKDIFEIKINNKMTVGDLLSSMIKDTYGAKVEEIFTDKFSEMVNANTVINNSFRFMFRAYKLQYDKEIAKLDGEVSEEAKIAIFKKLSHTFPAIKAPFSNADSRAIVVGSKLKTSEDLKYSPAQTRVEGFTNPLTGKPIKRITVNSMIREFEESLAAGGVVPIHYIDGSLIGNVLSHGGVIGVHDAILPPLTKAVEYSKQYNEDMHKINKKYSLIDEVTASFTRVMKSLSPEDVRQIESIKEQDSEVTIGNHLKELKQLGKDVKAARASLYANDMKIDHLTGVESVATIKGSTDAEATITIGSEEVDVIFVDSFQDDRLASTDKDGTIRLLKGLTKGKVLSYLSEGKGPIAIQKELVAKTMKDKFNINLNELLSGLTRSQLIRFIVAHELAHTKQRKIKDGLLSNGYFSGDTSIAKKFGVGVNGNKYLKDNAIRVEENANYYALRALDLIPEDAGDVLGSTDSKIQDDINQYESIQENISNDPTKIKELADLVNKLDKIELSESHNKTLDNVIDILIDPVAKKLPEIDIKLNQYAQENIGKLEVNAKEIYVGVGNRSQVSGLQMSAKEVLVHELVHGSNAYAFRDNSKETSPIRRQLRKIYEQARKELTPKDFIVTDGVFDQDVELAEATRVYNYIFNNKDGNGLEEFIAYGITNEHVAKALNGLTVNAKLLEKEKTLVGRLVQLAMKLYENVFNRNIDNMKIDKALMKLAIDMSNANTKQLKKVETGIYSGAFHIFSKANDNVAAWVQGIEDKLKDTPYKKGVGPLPVVANALKFLNDGPAKDTALQFLHNKAPVLFDKRGTMQSLIRDIRDKTEVGRLFERLSLTASQIESRKKRIESHYIHAAVQGYKEELTEIDKISLGHSLIETDASSLGVSTERLHDILLSNQELQKEVQSTLDSMDIPKDVKNYYKVQLEGLGIYMATHTSVVDGQLLNTHNIASKVNGDKQYLPQMDKIASLYAIKHSMNGMRLKSAEIIAKDPDGVVNMLQLHSLLKTSSKEQLFDKNEEIRSYIQGYVKDSYDEDVAVVVADVSEEAQLAREGYKMRERLSNDSLDSSSGDMALYVSTQAALSSYDKGLINITDKGARGTSLTKKNAAKLGPLGMEVTKRDLKKMSDRDVKAHKAMLAGTYKIDMKAKLVPLVDGQGNTKDYRYTMSKANKASHMGRSSEMQVLLGATAMSISDKYESQQMNIISIDAMIQDQLDNYTKGNYIEVSPTTTDAKAKEVYKLLPVYVKNRIKEKLGDTPLQVNADLYNTYFGSRALTIDNIYGNRHLGNMIRHVLKVAEKIWQEIVSIVKINIVIKTPAVLLGNITSNMLLSLMLGMEFKEVGKLQLEGLRALRQYKKDEKELGDLILKRDSGNVVDNGRIADLEKELERSAVKELIDAGLFQAIVEDVNVSDVKHKNRVARWFDDKSSRLPNWAREASNYLYLTERTPVFKAMMAATQYSDFVARYALYTSLSAKFQSQGKSIKEAKDLALNKSIDSFINYDLPDSALINYANKMGMVMFTKYFVRIQNVLRSGVKHNPLQTIAMVIGQDFLNVDLDDVTDQSVLSKSILAPVQSPIDLMGTFLMPHGYQAVRQYVI